MTKKRILEIIENMLQLGKITEQRINYNRALLDLAQKIIEEVDEDGDMQVREMRKGETMIKCNTCEYCDVNTSSDEAYCEANDGEQIILHRGQCRPKWCPLREDLDNFPVE